MELTPDQRRVLKDVLRPMLDGKDPMLISVDMIGLRSLSKVLVAFRVRCANVFPTMPMYIDDFQMILRLPEPPAEFELPRADTPRQKKDLKSFFKQHLHPAPKMSWPVTIQYVKEQLGATLTP